MINLGIENLFRQKGFEKPDSVHTIEAFGMGFKNVKFGSPRIIIVTSNENKTKVMYRMHLKSGWFHSRTNSADEDDQSSVSYKVNDWYFTFHVDLG
jgi:hypothetical protein